MLDKSNSKSSCTSFLFLFCLAFCIETPKVMFIFCQTYRGSSVHEERTFLHCNVYPDQTPSTVHFILGLSNDFLPYLFYYFLFLAETYMICVKVFYVLRNNILVWPNKKQNFPIDPHCKNRPLWQRRVYRLCQRRVYRLCQRLELFSKSYVWRLVGWDNSNEWSSIKFGEENRHYRNKKTPYLESWILNVVCLIATEMAIFFISYNWWRGLT